ncbi:hypothetical protein [Pannonibacter phragmitetus]|uniref:hypothetical protein n=1 Tax=Pannonibacter phragmitetus TaxID=121719 RepID=UPI000B961FD9|nr:hypothetical protein [Pannonibacter phragmitetus]
MVAMTKDRAVRSRALTTHSDPVAADAVIYTGALVCLNAAGNAVPGSTSTTLKARGVATDRVNNTDGAAGDVRVTSEVGVFAFANSASADEITRADIGATAYIVDDQTVAKTSGSSTRSAAGRIIDVDAAGVWVEIA